MKRRRLAVALVVVVVVVVVPPAVAWSAPIALCNGQTCSSGWYTSPITVSWDLNGGTNAGGCATQAYDVDTNQSSWPQNPSNLPPWAYCITNVQGGTDTRYAFIRAEVSSPVVAVAPSRRPDWGGWYKHPVKGRVSASSFSGIVSCSSTTYAGPSSATATLSATCRDNAGKTVTVASGAFGYNVTPPALTVQLAPGDRSVSLSWQTGGDPAPLASVRVRRASGGEHALGPTVYRGTSSGYDDTHVRNGTRYTYTIRVRDQAGYASVRTVAVIPGPRLLAPIANVRVSTPPVLIWTPVRGATYYNVQLYRQGKVLSRWPRSAKLQLRRRWRFDRHRYRLKPGRYRWFVWPGYGKRSLGRYGRVIGSGTFVVVR